MGYIAVARDFALGNIAHAAQANTELASQMIKPDWFFKGGQVLGRYSIWMNFLWIAPMLFQWRLIAHSRRERKNA
jgi:hypothetical protein